MFTNHSNASMFTANQSTNNSTADRQRRSLREKMTGIALAAAVVAAAAFVAPSASAQERPERSRAASSKAKFERDTFEVRGSGEFNANPVAELSSRQVGQHSLEAAPNVHGTFSVQTFPNPANNLGKTHASAKGFRDFLTNNGYQANFAVQDGNVKPELFLDTFSTFGVPFSIDGAALDSVLAAWHSSHGSMSDNVYTTSMGASGLNWVGLWPLYGDTVTSSVMALGGTYNGHGNQRLRYLFWDTCYGIRFNGGNSPRATWAPRAKGIRMIFGYDTTSVDNENYGKYFWEEWVKGKSFSQAFLDASWRISTKQTPVAMAFGATTAEATNLRNTERILNWGAVSSNAASWSWYNAQTASSGGKQRPGVDAMLEQSAQSSVYAVEAQGNEIEAVRGLAGKFGINVELDGMVQSRPFGLKAVRTNGASLVVEANGNFELTFMRPAATGTGDADGAAVENDTLIERAAEAVNQFGIGGQQLEASLIRTLNEASGSEGAEDSKARVIEKTVIFDQVIGGLRFNDPEAGHLEVSFDAQTGQMTRLRSTLKQVAAAEQSGGTATTHTVETARAAALGKIKGAAQVEGADTRFAVVEGTESVGYSMVDGKATPVYRVQISDTQAPGSRPQEVIIPLAQSKPRVD